MMIFEWLHVQLRIFSKKSRPWHWLMCVVSCWKLQLNKQTRNVSEKQNGVDVIVSMFAWSKSKKTFLSNLPNYLDNKKYIPLLKKWILWFMVLPVCDPRSVPSRGFRYYSMYRYLFGRSINFSTHILAVFRVPTLYTVTQILVFVVVLIVDRRFLLPYIKCVQHLKHVS